MAGRRFLLGVTLTLTLFLVFSSASGRVCYRSKSGGVGHVRDQGCHTNAKDDYCVRQWSRVKGAESRTCISLKRAVEELGFPSAEGCGPVLGSAKRTKAYACICSKDNCNDDLFGKGNFEKFKNGDQMYYKYPDGHSHGQGGPSFVAYVTWTALGSLLFFTVAILLRRTR